jgi:hypothetical protein
MLVSKARTAGLVTGFSCHWISSRLWFFYLRYNCNIHSFIHSFTSNQRLVLLHKHNNVKFFTPVFWGSFWITATDQHNRVTHKCSHLIHICKISFILRILFVSQLDKNINMPLYRGERIEMTTPFLGWCSHFKNTVHSSREWNSKSTTIIGPRSYFGGRFHHLQETMHQHSPWAKLTPRI